jgi:hypothetical protein
VSSMAPTSGNAWYLGSLFPLEYHHPPSPDLSPGLSLAFHAHFGSLPYPLGFSPVLAPGFMSVSTFFLSSSTSVSHRCLKCSAPQWALCLQPPHCIKQHPHLFGVMQVVESPALPAPQYSSRLGIMSSISASMAPLVLQL